MSPKLAASLAMLDDITRRARAMNIGLVSYPVDDVERIVAVLSAGRVLAAMAEAAQPAEEDVPASLEKRLALLLAEIVDAPLTIFAGGAEPGDKPMHLRLYTLRPDLSERAAELLEEAGE